MVHLLSYSVQLIHMQTNNFIFFRSMSSAFGVNHLSDFESNQILLSHVLSILFPSTGIIELWLSPPDNLKQMVGHRCLCFLRSMYERLSSPSSPNAWLTDARSFSRKFKICFWQKKNGQGGVWTLNLWVSRHLLTPKTTMLRYHPNRPYLEKFSSFY